MKVHVHVALSTVSALLYLRWLLEKPFEKKFLSGAPLSLGCPLGIDAAIPVLLVLLVVWPLLSPATVV